MPLRFWCGGESRVVPRATLAPHGVESFLLVGEAEMGQQLEGDRSNLVARAFQPARGAGIADAAQARGTEVA